jgi:hypothetical protein
MVGSFTVSPQALSIVRITSCEPVTGGAAGWELTPWLGVDGSLAWPKTFGDAETFTTAVNARAHFLTTRAVSPYVRAGFGLYRTLFSSSLTDVPDFYRRRTVQASTGYDSSYRFADPAWVFGAGLTISRAVTWRFIPRLRRSWSGEMRRTTW